MTGKDAMRVVVAMSGGVDSAVAAALLVERGYQVVGVTLQLADLSREGLGVSRCCSLEDVAHARAVCEQLGIPHYVLDMEEDFRQQVLQPFVESYLGGQTPSPCVRCNSRVKFGRLLEVCRELGGERLASGHYARVVRDARGIPHLLRGVDRDKDQSYFLFELTRAQLSRVEFPLGELTKAEVRQLARRWGLLNAEKRDSQEVCFVPGGSSYVEVLKKLAPQSLPGPGEIVDGQGSVLGQHPGFVHFTIGQRRGLGVAQGRRLYVVGLSPAENRVVVGELGELSRRTLWLTPVNWLAEATSLRCEVQVRSRHRPQAASVEVQGQGAVVEFVEPVLAPAPGQAAVCYEGDEVLGGGFIARAA